MKNTEGLLSRIQRLMPEGIQPRFTTSAELLAWHQEEGRKRSAELDRENQRARSEKILGRSGICNLHRKCTFANYQVSCDAQRTALSSAKSYAEWFGNGFASFVFSGSVGTGKNHLAAAIGNHILASGKTVLVVTVSDLMLQIRASYDGGKSEAALLDDLCKVDLLILDEVGVQRETRNEFVLLNQIIDRRSASMKPVGVLTNLNFDELSKVLGQRVMDRLTMDHGMWVNFNWESYRTKVRSNPSTK
jgi:putative replication protein